MKKVYEIATGKEFVMTHAIDAREAVLTGFYSYEPPAVDVKTEEVPEVFENRRSKRKIESSYPDSPLSE